MAFVDDVRARIPSAEMIKLTRFREDGATTENTTLSATIASDAEAVFRREVGRAYNDTRGEDRIAAVAIFRLIAHELGGHAGKEIVDRLRETWEDHARRLRETLGGSADRLTPRTPSELTPSDEVQGGATVRPWADPENFAPTQVRRPRGTRYSDSALGF